MESRKGDRLERVNKKEIHADNVARRYRYFALARDCMRAESLLDDYIFSRDDVSSEDAAFIDAHINNCQECQTKYTELLQWKNLLTSAKYESPGNLRKSVMDYINEEHKKSAKRRSFKKIMVRFSAAAASVLMLTVSVLIISVMNKNPMSDSMSSQNDMIMYSENSTEAAAEGVLETSELDEDNGVQMYSSYSLKGYEDQSDNNEIDMSVLPEKEEENLKIDEKFTGASPDAGSNTLIIADQEIAEEEPAYEKRVAITSVASSPPPLSECKKFIDAVCMLDYINIIVGEDNVQKWLNETISSDAEPENEPETVPEAEQKQDSGFISPLLYEAVAYFEINEETLIALDKTSEGAEYYLGEDAIKALYSRNWDALYKYDTSPEGE